MCHYIGKKGYTIQKESFTQTELNNIRSDMTVKPNNSMNGFITNVQYPIYRESSTKIYLPRYYGIEKFEKLTKIFYPKENQLN